MCLPKGRVYVCSAMDDEEAAFTCPPRECGGYSEGFCGNRPVLGDDGMAADDECLPCDAVEVVITPKARHAATQAALAAAEFAIAGYLERGVKPVWPDILAKLRKAKGESDD